MTTKIESLQLSTSREAKPSGNPGPNDIFYSSTDYNIPIHANLTKATLSSTSNGTGDTYVDDKVTITINGTEVFSHDYSHSNSGAIHPLPPHDMLADLTPHAGNTITIETTYTDLYKNSNGASNFFLYMEYTA